FQIQPQAKARTMQSEIRLALTLTLSPRGEGTAGTCSFNNCFDSLPSWSGGLRSLNAPDRQVTDYDSPSPGGEGRGEGEPEFRLRYRLNAALALLTPLGQFLHQRAEFSQRKRLGK